MYLHPPQDHHHHYLHHNDHHHQFKPQFRWFNGRTNKPKTVIVNPAVIVGWRTAKSSPDYVCKCLLRGEDANLLISYIFHFIESTTVFLLAWSICIYDIDLLHLWYISSLFVNKYFYNIFYEMDYVRKCLLGEKGVFFLFLVFSMKWIML